MLVLKQTIPQKKALLFSFKMTPWNNFFLSHADLWFLQLAILLNFMAARRVFDFLPSMYKISRTPLLSYSHFEGVKLKLNNKAFFWGIVCFSTSIDFFQILNSKIFQIHLLHPVFVLKGNKKVRNVSKLECPVFC